MTVNALGWECGHWESGLKGKWFLVLGISPAVLCLLLVFTVCASLPDPQGPPSPPTFQECRTEILGYKMPQRRDNNDQSYLTLNITRMLFFLFLSHSGFTPILSGLVAVASSPSVSWRFLRYLAGQGPPYQPNLSLPFPPQYQPTITSLS